jgi:ABC-type multidrug transport system fused ATPase/permease subunit
MIEACKLAQAHEFISQSPRATTPTSSRAAQTCPAARSRGSASQGRF